MHYILLLLFAFSLNYSGQPKGCGKSQSVGTVSKGHLVNGRKFPFKGENYRYFSWTSYHLLNRAWVHQKVLDVTLNTYKRCQTEMPNQQFLLMECSHKKGGRMWPHRTHQNGISIDFGTPLIKDQKPTYLHHHFGLFHYAMAFNASGQFSGNPTVKVDFETMAQHLLLLDNEARKKGMYIKKVIFKINLKDDLFKTPTGKKLQQSGIYFAQSLPTQIDNLHDEHYHVDFGFL